MSFSTTGQVAEFSPAEGLTREASQAAARELRVLHIFSVLGIGGAETWMISLLRYLNEAAAELPVRVKFDILLTGGERSVFDAEAEELGATLFYVPFTRQRLPRFLRDFRRVLAKGNYDAIHDHQDLIAGWHFALGAGRLPRIRVAHVHNPLYHRQNYANSFAKRLTTTTGRLLVKSYATHVMGTSRQIVNEYRLGSADSRLISGAAHCGFDVSQFRGDYDETHAEVCEEFGWPKESRVVLFVGRLDGDQFEHGGRTMTHKNPAFALEIMREVLAGDASVRFLMAGAGEEKRRQFTAQVAEWGLANRITLPGPRSDVPRLMIGSDLLLFPSLAEGLGMVVVEAQAAGLRVLASDTTPREAVVNDELVSFLSLSESAEKWGECVSSLLEEPRPNNEECYDKVLQSPFAIENSARRLLSIYLD